MPLLLLLALSTSAQSVENDKACLKAVSYLEAGNQSTKGVAAVIQVVRHRARKKRKSVCSVVREPHQFSSVKKGVPLRSVKIPKKWLPKYKKAVTMSSVLPKCTDSFHSGAQPSWAKRKRLVGVVQGHKFYC